MAMIAKCEDCGHEWHLADDAPPDWWSGFAEIGILSFDEPPHRFITWRCECRTEIGVWADRDGRPVEP
jgi:hypothetical protein